MFKMLANKLFGVRCERLTRNIAVSLVVFFSLRCSGITLEIAPFVLYLMSSFFTASILWQALCSEDNQTNLRGAFVMPFESGAFKMAYVAALGLYTVGMKTLPLLALAFAVANVGATEVFTCVLCVMMTVLMTASVYAWKRYAAVGVLWAAGVVCLYLLCETVWVLCGALVLNIGVCALLLAKADPYAFYKESTGKGKQQGKTSHSVVRYIVRYLTAHKNYMVNSFAMWAVACVLPMFLEMVEGVEVRPIGFVILSLNTPLCILLSCDPSLERAVRSLPGQKSGFCVPYTCFLAGCNLIPNVIFLCSWWIVRGEFSPLMAVAAVFFALQSAVGSVLLEWFFPVRGWKIESDLWHHPRKYIVPGVLVLLAGVVALVPESIFAFMGVLAVEIITLLFLAKNH